jgi:hypothetical protein
LSQFLEGRFTILKEDPVLYPHICLGSMTYMRTDVSKQATQCLAWGSMLHCWSYQTDHVLNKQSHEQVLAAEHPYKNQKYMSSSKLVWLLKLAKLKNNFPTRYHLHYNKFLYL